MKSFAIKISLLLYVLIFSMSNVLAQASKKELNASRVTEPITIDGKLDEAAWVNAPKASGFTQNSPRPGEPSTQRTEVSILYDDNAVYIGAMMYDTPPDSILHQLTPRDQYDYDNTDVFGVMFDTYHDEQNGFTFVVTAAGVQADGKNRFDGLDLSWNSAWYSKVNKNAKGWTVEIKVPYSELRFSKEAIQTWGLNFYRSIRRIREKSYWSPVLPGVPNFVRQAGILANIHDIKSPIRLALMPYLSAYGENYAGANAHTYNGGMDVKYGISQGFTLDMTLVPDFGQTLYDNKVLNLSPVEVRYDERRYFFTEGFDLFNKDDLFYSRRVGGAPVNNSTVGNYLDTNEVLDKNPSTTKLYNAVKVTGRTKGNLGIGFFNAVTAPAFATATDTLTNKQRSIETSPLTNYNAIVLDQALKNNSYVTFMNTNVNRKDNFYNANVSALLFQFSNKNNKYAIVGAGDLSNIYSGGRPDQGYRHFLDFTKISGNYTFAIYERTISDRFNPNDMGYLDRNNIAYYVVDQYYNIYKPFGPFLSASDHLGIDYFRVYNPSAFEQFNINGSHSVTWRSYLSTGFYWSANPVTTNDYYEPRTQGRYYLSPTNVMGGAYFSSDYRKRFALDGETNYRAFSTSGRKTYYWSLSPRFRFNDKLLVVYGINATYQKKDVGYVDNVSDSIYFGVRNITTIVNSLSASYIFRNNMSLSLSARHYWSEAVYSSYNFLSNDGNLLTTGYNTSHDVNFNSFNVFMNYIWQFKPGSEMSVVYQNIISSNGSDIVNHYADDLSYTFKSPQSNSLSVKIIYYLDYVTLRNNIKKI